MFGYIRPFKPDLKISEFEIYKAIYCRLCKHTGKKFGIISRILLNYDSCFLALISISLSKEKTKLAKGKCVCNCVKKCSYLQDYDDIFDFVSCVGIIMSYHKIQDNILDSKNIKRVFYYIPKIFFYLPYRSALKYHANIDNILNELMSCQYDVENSEEDISIDKSAHATSNALSKIFSLISPNLKDIGYLIGRWVYIIDAADDIEKDIKSNNFNPLKDSSIDKFQINKILNQTVARIIELSDDFNFNEFTPIIKNIIKLGLPEMQKNILFDKKEKNT